MPTYVVLANWTDQGIRNVKDTVTRAGQVQAAAERSGGRLVGSWWTQGAWLATRAHKRCGPIPEEMQQIIQKLP